MPRPILHAADVPTLTRRRTLLATGGSLVAGCLLRKPEARAEEALASPSSLSAQKPAALPALSFTQADGKTGTLAQYHGKPVIFHIWATWCPSCVIELQGLDRLAAALAPDAAVLAVALDRGGDKIVRPFLARHKIQTLAMLLDPHGATTTALDAEAVPLTLLVDRDGREILRHAGAVAWDSDVNATRKLLGLSQKPA